MQLGQNEMDDLATPTLIDLPEPIIQVSAGTWHSLFLGGSNAFSFVVRISQINEQSLELFIAVAGEWTANWAFHSKALRSSTLPRLFQFPSSLRLGSRFRSSSFAIS